MPDSKQILLIDDHSVVREGLCLLIRSAFPEVAILEASDFDELFAGDIDIDGVDLALVDLDLPGMQWQEGVKRLRKRRPALDWAVLSATESIEAVRQAMDLGARGFIPKATEPRLFTVDLEKLLAGESVMPPAIRAALEEVPRPSTEDEKDLLDRLTPRRRDLLPLLAEGLCNKEMARRLGIAEGTVKLHLRYLYKALGTDNRVKAAQIAARLQKGGA